MDLTKMTRSELRREIVGKDEEWMQEKVAELCGEITKICVDEPLTAPVAVIELASLARNLKRAFEETE